MKKYSFQNFKYNHFYPAHFWAVNQSREQLNFNHYHLICSPVASGEGQEAEDLDKETRKYIYSNVEDLKRAQVSDIILNNFLMSMSLFKEDDWHCIIA